MNVTSTVDVDVDPMTAFAAFTDEFDQWWGNGPIDAWDSSRCIGRRLEPGVGGRLLEVYEDDALELGRVTVWEPGARVCRGRRADENCMFGVTAVGTSAIFGAISGASAATVATIGKVMVPAMRRAGYPETFTAGLITAVGAIDVIIPPSIPMIVYGAVNVKFGACDTLYRIASDPRLNHRAQVVGGVLSERCAAILTESFAAKRELGKG